MSRLPPDLPARQSPNWPRLLLGLAGLVAGLVLIYVGLTTIG